MTSHFFVSSSLIVDACFFRARRGEQRRKQSRNPKTKSCLRVKRIFWGLGKALILESRKPLFDAKSISFNHKLKLLIWVPQVSSEKDEKTKSFALIKMGWSSAKKRREQKKRRGCHYRNGFKKVYLEPFLPLSLPLPARHSEGEEVEENDRFANDRSGMSRRYDNRHPFSNVE